MYILQSNAAFLLLNHGETAILDREDAYLLGNRKWWVAKRGDIKYASSSVAKNKIKTTFLLHREILGIKDKNILVDHIDGNGLNNCRNNLRSCNRSQNAMNSKSNKGSTSKYKGVCWDSTKKKWMSQIQINGKRIQLGTFHKEEDAAKVYDNSARFYFGVFARTNFESIELAS